MSRLIHNADGRTPLWDTEAIVREVMRRLQQRTERAPNDQRSAAPEPAREPRERLVIGERVVTLATLDGRLDGVRTLVTKRGAVVTPAVRDELKRRGIAWLREGAACEMAVRPLLLARDDSDSVCLRGWQERLGGPTQRLDTHDRRSVLEALEGWVMKPGVAVWWTRQPTSAVCAANKLSSVRGALAWTTDQVTEAITEAHINVLVVDARRRRDHEWTTWIERLRRTTEPQTQGA